MNSSVHATRYRVFHQELSDLLDQVLAGDVVADRAMAERVVRALGALLRTHERHMWDRRGKCGVCWTNPPRWWRPWPSQSACTVHEALSFFLRQPTEKIVTAIEDYPSARHG